MKTPVTLIMIFVCFIATWSAVFSGEVYHSIELFSLAVLLLVSLEPKR